MEELTTQVSAEDTTPTETHDDSVTPNEELGTPPDENNNNVTASDDVPTANNEPEFSLPITYNHENRNLTREEAVKYAQIGLNFEEGGIKAEIVKPVLRKLDYLAAQSDTTVEALVEGMLSAAENSYREELVNKFGDDETVIEDLMRVYHERQQAKYDKVLADRKTADETSKNNMRVKLETRLADEFTALKKEFPSLTEFTALPDDVKRSAAAGKSLAEAYLRYLYTENAKITANNNATQKAAVSTAGSLSTNQSEHETAVVDAFMRGFNS